MSVTTYEIGRKYDLSKLKNQVYFLNKDHHYTINIDNGETSATFVNPSPYPPSTNRLDGFNIKLQETESLDERYKFTKNLTMSINGHLTDASWLMEGDYYLVVQTEDGTYYIINVDFPSKMTYSYNLSEGQDQTDFTFTSNSNYPTLKFNWSPTDYTTCKTYNVYGIDKLQLLEKDYTTISSEQNVINLFEGQEFKNIDFLKNTISLQESYDSNGVETTISFDIPFDGYKSSWQYNLLEFTKNLYAAHITPKNSVNEIWCGYEHGLQPSYQIDGSTNIGEDTKITITLVESSQWGISEGSGWTYNRDTSKKWIGVDSECECTTLGVGKYILLQEVDTNDMPTGRYKTLEGYENDFPNLNIVGTFSDTIEFKTPRCLKMRTDYRFSGNYYCVEGDKTEAIMNSVSFDGGKTWKPSINGVNSEQSDYSTTGSVVEVSSNFCNEDASYTWSLKKDTSECRYDYTLDEDHTKYRINDSYECISFDENEYNGFRFRVVDENGNIIEEQACDGNSVLRSTDISLATRNASPQHSYYLIVGECINRIDMHDDDNTTYLHMFYYKGITFPKNSLLEIVALEGLYGDNISLVIPKTVKYLGDELFCDGVNSQPTEELPYKLGYRAITSVTFEEGIELEYMGRSFARACTQGECRGNTHITSVIIPHGITQIVDNTFMNCTSLTSVTIPDSVEEIGVRAFMNCTSLTSVNIPEGVEDLDWGAFSNCTSLSSVTISDNLTYIGARCFENCPISSFVFNTTSKLRLIEDNAFNGITIPLSLPPSVEEIIDPCNNHGTIFIPENSKLKLTVHLRSTPSTNYPQYLSQTEITGFLPNNLRYFGDDDLIPYIDAFGKIFGEKVTKITTSQSGFGKYHFGVDDTITMNSPYPPECNVMPSDFRGVIRVPNNSVDLYKSDSYWSQFANYITGF